MDKATRSRIEKFEEKFTRTFGTTLERSEQFSPYDTVSTGSIALDVATRIGGYPRGRLIEVWGPESVGKTTLQVHAAVAHQRAHPDLIVGWCDMERTFSKQWAVENGLDLSRFWIYPDPEKDAGLVISAEDIAAAHMEFVRSGLCSISILDSIGAMETQKELDRGYDDPAAPGSVARVVTKLVKQAANYGASNGTTSVLVNQPRAVIGNAKGPTTTTGGGWALRHASTMKLWVRRGPDAPRTVKVHGEEQVVGQQVLVTVEKNKVGAPKGVARIWLAVRATEQYGPIGINPTDEAVDFAVRSGAVTQGGAIYTTSDGVKHKGKEKMGAYLAERPEMVAEVRARMLAQVHGPLGAVPDEEDNDPIHDEVAEALSR